MTRLFNILIFVSIASIAFSQNCVVDTIIVPQCQEINQYIVPVYFEYTGKPDSVKVEMTGTQYEFPDQYFRGFNHFVGDSTNSFEFVFYHVLDGLNDNFSCTVTLIGNTCNNESLTQQFIYDGLDCLCIENYMLTGTLSVDSSYIAGNYISTDQIVSAGVTVSYDATNYIEYAEGFQVDSAAIWTSNLNGCVVN